MRDATSTLSAFDRHSLFEACAREAERLGGDERTAEYFFGRAQSSRVWLSEQGAATIADMDIADWCSAIAWSAPGVGRAGKHTESDPSAAQTTQSAIADAIEPADTNQDIVSLDVDVDAEKPTPVKSGKETHRKQPRSGARAKSSRA